MKRTIRSILILLLLMLVFSACQQSDQEQTFAIDFNAGTDGNVDLGGYTMKYALCAATIYGDTSAENVLGYVPNTPFSDLARQRISEVEANFNCVIEDFYAQDGADVSRFNLYSAAAMYYTDAIQSSSEWLIDAAMIDMLVGMSTVSDYIDYLDSDKWGSARMLESMCYGDDLYAVAPMAWPELCYTTFGYPIVFNSGLFTKLGVTDLREIREQGEWTWDKFKDVLEACTVTENDAVKYYAMEVHDPYFDEMMFRSNGATLYNITNGEYNCGYYNDDRATKAIVEAHELYNGIYAHCFKKTNEKDPDLVIDDFINELVVMTACDTEHLYGLNAKISMNMENFGIVTWPTGPDVETDYVFSVHEALRFATSISSLANDIDATAFILNELYKPLEGYDTFADIRAYMERNYFFDTRDADIFFEMFYNSYYNYFHFDARTLAYNLQRTVKTPIATMESYEDLMETIVDEDIAPMASAMEAIFG